jgi:endonuclease/exonuclease/phosphatase family metal-dependent hydrolase
VPSSDLTGPRNALRDRGDVCPRGRTGRRAGAVFALALWCTASASGLTIMSYNVENLFDDVRDGSEYREFDPGRGKWNSEAFLLRVKDLSEVVRKSMPGGPDILLLQEVENGNALSVFVDRGARGMGYAWHVLVPKKGLAANVAIASRVPISRIRTHAVGPWKNGAAVRDILEAEFQVAGHTLYVFNNHWKSRTEGAAASEASRRESAAVLSGRIGEILSRDPSADIVAAGDMNESTDEYARLGRRMVTALMPAADGARGVPRTGGIHLSAQAPPFAGPAGCCTLFDPWFEMDEARRGSSSWQGAWITPDHMLLSAGLFDRRGFSYRLRSFASLRMPFLLDERGLPRRWDARGGRGGFSDHLPLLLTLDLRG